MLAKSIDGVITLRDYAEDSENGNASRMANYTYKEARLSNSKTGTVVTGFLGKETSDSENANKKTYFLKYTTSDPVPAADASSWKDIPTDAITGSSNNSVDVYLIYVSESSMTIHYVNEAGTDVAAADVKYFDTMTDEDGVVVSTLAKTQDVTSGYSFETDGGRLSSTLGQKVYSIKAVADHNGNYTFQYKTSSDADWITADKNVTDLYLLYSRSSGRKITIHYVDTAGIPIEVDGQAVIRVVYPDEWTDKDYVLKQNSTNFYVDNQGNKYVDLSKYAESFDGYLDFDRTSVNVNASTGSGLMYAPGYLSGKIQSSQTTRGAVTGRNFRFVRYSGDALYMGRVTSLGDNNISAGNDGAINQDIDVYMFYRRVLRIHYVDSNGNELYDTYDSNSTIIPNSSSFSSAVTLNTDEMCHGHGTPEHIYANKPTTGALQTDLTSIAWRFDTTSKSWQTQLNGTETDNSLISDVYMVYPSRLNVTVHHVDESGNKVADDSTQTVSPSDTGLTIDAFKKTVANYDATSVYYGGSASTGTVFSAIKFTKNDNQWKYALDNGTATNINGNAEICVVYTKKTDGSAVTIHFVDDSGNNLKDSNGNDIQPFVVTTFTVSSSGNTYSNWNGGNFTGRSDITSSPNYKSIPSGYTFAGEYLGPTFSGTAGADNNKLVNSTLSGKNAVQWHYETGNSDSTKNGWYTSHSANAKNTHSDLSAAGVYHDYITDIYWVYTNKQNLNIHYMHVQLNDNGEIVRDSNGNPQYQLYGADQLGDNYPSQISYQTVADAGSDGIDLTTGTDASTSTYAKSISIQRGAEGETQTDTYYGSYLGTPRSATDQLPDYALISSDGPHVNKVRIGSNGQYEFLSTTGVNDYEPLTQVQRNVWTYTTTAGRTFTLRKEDNGSLNIVDSDGGTNAFDLNLVSSDGTANTYTANSGAEDVGVAFTVKEHTSDSTYTLNVQEWESIPEHDIYQLYVNENSPLINIGDEIIYSGNLVARTTHFPADAKVVSYKWEKQVNGGAWSEVTRSRSGNAWNIANDLNNRSWLNLVADNGELSQDEGRSSVKYRVTLTYTQGDETKSVTSVEYSVPYWDQLENGSFETPVVPGTKSNMQYANTDNQDGAADDYKKSYASQGGVWHTTGLGKDSKKSGMTGHDIEIINTATNTKYRDDYSWQGTDGAKAGSQFAELNCETAGALYQDVITDPNEYLNYWLSHRARGKEHNADPNKTGKYTVYDSMYLVIMPTRLAMTSGSNGGELRTQSDLEKFISDHAGSFAKDNPGKIDDEVVYRNTNSGVLIEKISSSNQEWHNITATNGYIATSTLTRFFFVAANTASNDNTVGNFLDDVGFSQKLPTPATPHYHMVVEKDFTGLTVSDVAKLASNRTSDGKGFQLNINEYTKNSDGKTYSLRTGTPTFDDSYYEYGDGGTKEQSLNGATLGFTVDDSDNFTLTATGIDPNDKNKTKTVDLLSKDNGTGSTGVVSIDPTSGTVRMRWTLTNNYFGKAEKPKYFQVTESGADVDGYAVNASNTASTLHKNASRDTFNSESPTKTGYIEVKDQDTVLAEFTNDYTDNSQNEPDQIRIQKTFTGITPSVVDQLTGSATPFEITVSKSASGDKPITLIGNEDMPVLGNYPTGVDRVQLDTKKNDDGSSTYTWTIYGTKDDSWIFGNNYYVKEKNYTPDSNNPVTGITVNGKVVSVDGSGDSQGKKIWPTGDSEYQKVSVGQPGDIPEITAQGNASSITNSATNINSNTYLIIAKYTLGASKEPHYLVWTQDTMSVNEKATIGEIISAKFTDNGTVDASSVGWRSGKNPGKMEINANEGEGQTKGSMTYDSTTGNLSFTDSTGAGAKWQSYYSMVYNQDNIPNNRERTTEIRIKNSYEPAIRVMKISSGDSPTPLANAEFKLYTYVTSSGKTSKMYFGTNKQFSTGENGAVTFQTNSEGVAVGNISNNESLQIINSLRDGTYYLEETKAPPGYNMPSKNVVAIKVNSDGIVTQITDTSKLTGPSEIEKDKINTIKDGDGITVDWNSPYYTVMVRNKPGVLLPITGGIGTYIFYIAGAVLIIIAGVLLVKRKKAGDPS